MPGLRAAGRMLGGLPEVDGRPRPFLALAQDLAERQVDLGEDGGLARERQGTLEQGKRVVEQSVREALVGLLEEPVDRTIAGARPLDGARRGVRGRRHGRQGGGSGAAVGRPIPRSRRATPHPPRDGSPGSRRHHGVRAGAGFGSACVAGASPSTSPLITTMSFPPGLAVEVSM